jgi:predicted membrane protein
MFKKISLVLLFCLYIFSLTRDNALQTIFHRIILFAFVLFGTYIHPYIGILMICIIILSNHSSLLKTSFEGFESNEKKIKSTINTAQNNLPMTANINTAPSSKEGFDIIGIEHMLKKGKQSNSVSVQPFLKNNDFVSPSSYPSF